jgi:histidine ammonia-lyase
MAVTLSDRGDFTLKSYLDVAWRGTDVAVAPAALRRMAETRAAFLRLIERGGVIYGVTSGYGGRAHHRLTPEERRRHAARPPYGPAAAFGGALPERVVRGTVFARLANFVEGHAAVRPELATAVAAMLASPLPTVPLEGHGGAGEITLLSPLFSDLAARFGSAEKETLALINGSPAGAALLADAALSARRRLNLALDVVALAAEAFRAPLDAYDAALDALWGDAEEAKALAEIRRRLSGGVSERRPYQAPVSFRIVPRLLGRAIRAVNEAETAAEVSLRSITDNPVYLPPDADHPDGRVLSNGGYHNARAVPAMDELAACAADLALLAERQTAKLQEGRVSLLPDRLQRGPDDDRFLGVFGMVAVAFGERARHAAQRTFLPGPESGGFDQNDVASPVVFAWDKARQAGEALDGALAVLAYVALHALDVTDRVPPPALAARAEAVRRLAPRIETMHALGPEVGRVAAAFTAETLRP